jgi:hypothetical protein
LKVWPLAIVAVLAAASPAAGQDSGDGAMTALGRSLELPFHDGLVAVIGAPDTTLAPFATDGCSGGLSATWGVVADLFPEFAAAHDGRPPWEDCCVEHDRVYHDADRATDAETSYDARLAADEALRRCVRSAGERRAPDLAAYYGVTETQVQLAYGAIGDAMFNAVRFGGAPCSGLPWRWGYGFPGCFVMAE